MKIHPDITPDAILTHVQADVIFAMYGYNESYRQDPERFKRELRAFIKDTREQQYNGKSTPRLVLFSPGVLHRINPLQGERYSVAVNLWASEPLTTPASAPPV